MKPVDQTRFHKPDEGEHGNCMQAAVASLLELPLEQVPNFIEEEDGFWESWDKFVASRGFKVLKLPLDQVKWLGIPYLAYGKSSRGVSHAVIYQQGEMIHDPHPSREGVLSVDYVHVFVPDAASYDALRRTK